MNNRLIPVNDSEGLQQLFKISHERPIVLFKHSLTCPVSAAAYREMSQFDGEVSIVVVQRAREVSREIESRTGIRHESPQAIVLRNGDAVWNASHWRVTSSALEEALREHA